MHAINAYHLKHQKYPEYIEATEKFLKCLSRTVFTFEVPEEECLIHQMQPQKHKIIQVRIIPVIE